LNYINRLKELIENLPGDPMDKIYCLSIILLYKEMNCIGRTYVYKRLGLTEWKTRSYLEELIKRGLLERTYKGICISRNTSELLKDIVIKRENINEKMLICIGGLPNKYYEFLNKNIVNIRDNIIIYTHNPRSFEVIGYKINGRILIPGITEEYRAKYNELLSDKCMDNSLFILWNDYKEYIYDAIALYSLLTRSE
jgi:predicted transcriptional regulator